MYKYVLALNKAALEESEHEGFRKWTMMKILLAGIPSNFSDICDVREAPNAIFYSSSVNFVLALPFILKQNCAF